MSKPVKITTDSTADLSPELIKKYDVTVIPLYVEMDGKYYKDGIDIHPEDLYQYYEKTGKTARSSAVNVGEYAEIFREFTEQGYAVVHIGLGDFLSSSYQNACVAAQEFNDVYAVNSKNSLCRTNMGGSLPRRKRKSWSGLPAVTQRCV